MTRDIPYTSDDLRYIAEQIENVTDDLPKTDLEDGDWRWGLTVEIFDDGGDTVGQLRPHGDGWIGFYPKEIK